MSIFDKSLASKKINEPKLHLGSSKHKSEDKLSSVKYYLENKTSYSKTCEIFKCSEQSHKQ
jgi:hypothetical protein